MPSAAPSLRRDLYLRMAALRRVSLVAGIAVAFIFAWTVAKGRWALIALHVAATLVGFGLVLVGVISGATAR